MVEAALGDDAEFASAEAGPAPPLAPGRVRVQRLYGMLQCPQVVAGLPAVPSCGPQPWVEP